MIDLFLKVIDRLIQLAKLQEKRLGVRFSQIYTSTFSELEDVHRDYLLMFDDLQALLRDIPENAKLGNKKAEAALKWFEKRRRELAPVRQKLQDFERVVGVYSPMALHPALRFLVSPSWPRNCREVTIRLRARADRVYHR